MSSSIIRGQTIAIAGILQCAYLVDKIATTGEAPLESFNPSVNSLFQFDGETPEEVYGGIPNLKLGLKVINDVIGGQSNPQNHTVIRYALGMLHLQKQLMAKPEMLQIIRSRLEHAAIKAEHFSDSPYSLASSVAQIYQDTLSTFKYRIQIGGNKQQLENTTNADNIRALLLAGIRSAVLWRQLGGRRWQLFIKRQSILKTSRQLLQG